VNVFQGSPARCNCLGPWEKKENISFGLKTITQFVGLISELTDGGTKKVVKFMARKSKHRSGNTLLKRPLK